METNYLKKRTPQERLIIAKTLLETVIDDMPFVEKAQLSGEDATSDLIRRQDAIDALGKEPKFKIKMIKTYAEGRSDQWFKDVATIASLPSVEPTIIRCKDCKHFEYDHFENVNGIPLIVAHEICMKWCEGTKTSENGYCFLAERKDNG